MSSRQVSKVQPDNLVVQNSLVRRSVSYAGMYCIPQWWTVSSSTPGSGKEPAVLQPPARIQVSVAASDAAPQATKHFTVGGTERPSARLVHCSSIQSFLYRGLHQVRSPHSQHLSLQPCWAGPGTEDAIWNILIHSCQMPMVSLVLPGSVAGKGRGNLDIRC